MDKWIKKNLIDAGKIEGVHAHGMAVVGIQGAGKSYFVDHQTNGNARWVDADDFLVDLNVLKPGDTAFLEAQNAVNISAVSINGEMYHFIEGKLLFIQSNLVFNNMHELPYYYHKRKDP